MGITRYDITSAAFQPERAPDYELSILAGMDSFAYAIRDRTTNTLLAYRSTDLDPIELDNWSATLDKLVRDDLKLRTPRYGSRLLAFDSPRATLVPRELYREEQRRAYLEQLTALGLEDEVRAESFHELDAALVFAAPADRLAATERRLMPRRTHHPAGGVLVAWGKRSERLQHVAVSAAIRGRRIMLAAHRAGRLLFFNSFQFVSAEEAVYYVLLAYREAGVAPTRAALYLCGEVTEHSELYRHFYTYVEDVRFCQSVTPPAAAPELAQVPGHVFFELLCLG